MIIGRNSRNHQPLLPPCPPRLPILGNLHQLSSLPHQSLQSLSKKHGPLMLLKLGQAPTLIVSSADAAKEIMRTHDHIFASRPSLRAANIALYGGRDIVFSPYGEHWRQIRKLSVTHLLNPKTIRALRPVLEGEVASLISRISEMSTSSIGINMSEVLNMFVSNYLCRVVFGDGFVEEGRRRVICGLIEQTSLIFGMFCVGDFIPALGWLDALSGFTSKAEKVSKNWESVLEEIIEEHVNSPYAEERKPDLVDALLAVQKDPDHAEFPISRVMIRAILHDMIGAGTDTTFLVLDWAMAELVRNPEVMKRLKDEVRNVATTSESFVMVEHLSEMSYLKAVIKEVLRLHPPAPLLIPRVSMDRCRIQGYEIPKQTRVLINAWAICRDPTSWEAPEEFRPDRFLGSSIDYKGHDFEFIPFGAGRRICPGMQFSTSTVEMALANLVKSFDWELPVGMKCEDLDMTETPGLTTRRRQNLYLVATSLKI